MQKLIRNKNLHSQTVQGVIDVFYQNIDSWRGAKKINPNARMPKRRKWYFVIPYKTSAIRVKEGKLILSNGKGNEPFILNWRYSCPKTVSITYNNGYSLNAVYAYGEPKPLLEGETAGIDLGEIHIAVASTGAKTIITNGRKLRSIRRYQNKVKGHFQRKTSALKKGSRRYKQLNGRKRKILRHINNQIKDVLHKQTTKLVLALKKEGVKTVAIGDVRNLRQNIDYGAKANQRIHQMISGETRFMITYKAKKLGMNVSVINESYSSQTCPKCLNRHKPSGREYRCPVCGFEYHRDGVGAINIRNKKMYQGYVPVVGDMIPPVGMRYTA
jgi:putative transposase